MSDSVDTISGDGLVAVLETEEGKWVKSHIFDAIKTGTPLYNEGKIKGWYFFYIFY